MNIECSHSYSFSIEFILTLLYSFISIHSDFLLYWTSSFQFIHLSLKTIMGKLKHSRVGPRKPSLPTSRTLIFTLFVTFTFLIIFLILLSLRIPKPKHLNSITHINTLRFFFNSTTDISFFLLCFLSLWPLFRVYFMHAEVMTMRISVRFKSYRGSLEYFYIIIFWSVLSLSFLFIDMNIARFCLLHEWNVVNDLIINLRNWSTNEFVIWGTKTLVCIDMTSWCYNYRH